MGYLAQRPAKFSGKRYEPGEPVPNDIGSLHLLQMDLVSSIPDEQVERIVGAWDPASHTVDETKDFVSKWPEQTERVLDAEEAGENRTTLVEWLQARGEADAEVSGYETDTGGSVDTPTSNPGEGEPSGSPSVGEAIPGGDVSGDEATEIAYVPGDHTVPQVLAYVNERPDALEAVLAAERQGKQRVTLMQALEGLAEERVIGG